MTSPRIHTARRRAQNGSATTNTIALPSDYGSDIEVEKSLVAVGAKQRGYAHSDYGSDFDTEGEQIVAALFSELDGRPQVEDDCGNESVGRNVDSLRRKSSGSTIYYSAEGEEQVWDPTRVQEEGRGGDGEDQGSQTTHAALAHNLSYASASSPQATVEIRSSIEPTPPDTRSPLERFRSPPKKPLSVTDLVSPAWCELQYWFTLTKYGRKRPTPAMKHGTRVHQALEAQVHDVVLVDVTTREDGWGLRIWNVIQGLRTLRVTGMTRELEVWGVVDGEVVNGIIDELGVKCPDPELEEALNLSKAQDEGRKVLLHTEQKSVLNYYDMTQGHDTASPWHGTINTRDGPPRKIYLTDVKTRVSPSLPRGPSLRSTKMQLHLYHHLLTALASNNVPADIIFDRYNLNPQANFTDGFIAAIAALEDNFLPETATGDDWVEFNSQADSVSELSQHNSLTLLWTLMITEFARTIPSAAYIGNVLQAEFRKQSDGETIGSRVFPFEEGVLKDYVEDALQWWRGEREARGVEVEDAWKCGVCEFREGCHWREGRVEEALKKYNERRAKSGR